MSFQTQKKCPDCRGLITSPIRKGINIGPPFLVCQNCNEVVMLENYNEWQLMTPSIRTRHILLYLFICVLWISVVIGLAGLLKDHIPDELFVTILVLGIPAASAFKTYCFFKEIKHSRQRMIDPQYRKAIKRFGFDLETNHGTTPRPQPKKVAIKSK